MVNCWFCQIGNMQWNSDFSFEDVGYEGDGIIAMLFCDNEDCGASAEFQLPLGERIGE